MLPFWVTLVIAVVPMLVLIAAVARLENRPRDDERDQDGESGEPRPVAAA